MPVRLKDVARELGVSVVTVSKVLRGAKDVGEETRSKVLRRLKELKYQPNIMARGLATGRTFTMGLIVPDLVHPFFAELAKSLSGALRESHRALILASSEEDSEVEAQEIRTLLSRGVDVLLVASCQPQLHAFHDGADLRTPFVLIDRNFPDLSANFVGTDDVKAGEIATEHLVSLGRRHIAHIGGDQSSTALDRTRGYRRVLEQHGRESEDNLVMVCSHFEETGDLAGYQCMQALLKKERRPDAVFCYNDLTAIGAMKAALDAGVRIPEDVAFVGCGNMRYSDYLQVPLSSVDQNTSELGRAAASLALAIERQSELPPRSILTEPRLVVRRSSAGS
jgi:LacI family transcriptional regulator, galactose operon repressor